MFSGFRFMRQQGDDVEATLEITLAALREFPLWAIEQACLKIARGKAGLDRRYSPNDAEIVAVVADIVAVHVANLQEVRGLLGARVRDIKKRPRPTQAEIEAKFGRPLPTRPRPESDFERRERMQRIADDLALRNARNEVQQQENQHGGR